MKSTRTILLTAVLWETNRAELLAFVLSHESVSQAGLRMPRFMRLGNEDFFLVSSMRLEEAMKGMTQHDKAYLLDPVCPPSGYETYDLLKVVNAMRTEDLAWLRPNHLRERDRLRPNPYHYLLFDMHVEQDPDPTVRARLSYTFKGMLGGASLRQKLRE